MPTFGRLDIKVLEAERTRIIPLFGFVATGRPGRMAGLTDQHHTKSLVFRVAQLTLRPKLSQILKCKRIQLRGISQSSPDDANGDEPADDEQDE